MRIHRETGLLLVALVGSTAGGVRIHAQEPAARGTAAGFTVTGQIALHSLMSLSDAHMQKLADVLTIVAASGAARSGDWERIRGPLAQVARMNVPAVHWFALPDGTYWTLEQGRATATLSDRAYFPRVLAGRTVLGDLVVSHSSGHSTAIVAVPVRARDDSVVGVLGSSVHLDSLSLLIRKEMGGLAEDVIFFAIDATPLGALNSDPALIFTEPMKLGDAGMRKAFSEMIASREGVVTYDFRGSRRTVLYRRSPVTGWWYGLGVLRKAEASR